MKQSLSQIAEQLDQAMVNAKTINQFSQDQPMSLKDAYQVQKEAFQRRVDRGEAQTGYKLGFTSKAKMEQMGVHEIIWGRLSDTMKLANSGALPSNKFIHPRVEPEVAFRISKPITSELSLEDIPTYIDGITIALEIIDSRYENFKFSLEDVVADNCSSAAFVIGEWHPTTTSVQDLSIALNLNGQQVAEGNSNAILGNPLASLLALSKMAVKYEETIAAGSIILAGAATPAIHLKSGDKVKGIFSHLGSLQFEVT